MLEEGASMICRARSFCRYSTTKKIEEQRETEVSPSSRGCITAMFSREVLLETA